MLAAKKRVCHSRGVVLLATDKWMGQSKAAVVLACGWLCIRVCKSSVRNYPSSTYSSSGLISHAERELGGSNLTAKHRSSHSKRG
jgi:hypothetical protein